MRLILVSLLCLFSLPAMAFQLAPYKDQLFAYPPVMESADRGNYLRVAYDKQRDIYGRDAIPRRKVKDRYITFNLGWSRRTRSYKTPNGTKKYSAIGAKSGARVTVIYLYGRGGNRLQGVNDRTFGGNFNRLQVLMRENGGLLMTPDYTDFKDRGTADIAALIALARSRSPNTFLIVACGSMGGGVCWRLAENPATARKIDGMFLLGSHWNYDFLKSTPYKERAFPIYFGHGTADSVFPAQKQSAFYRALKKSNPGYPARFVMFDTGVHGTPIRMVDWRREINWMLSRK